MQQVSQKKKAKPGSHSSTKGRMTARSPRSCSKSEQKQLNTWVSFQSAEQPLLGQFSVSGNTKPHLAAGGVYGSVTISESHPVVGEGHEWAM